jgi:hypothetical protein
VEGATAFAFKAGPPEGHATAGNLKLFPDWRLSSGHAHPDAGSFIIWSRGKYLTGDSGYAGIPLTEHHNTLVFNGKGQAKEGEGHDVFAGVSYDRLDKIHISEAKLNDKKVLITADLTAAYEPEVGVRRFIRRFDFTVPGDLTVTDDIETNVPQTITAFLHSDNKIVQQSKNIFEFEPNGTSLFVEIVSPQKFDAKIEKNILTAPGKPGSVDKGEREDRGVRLAVSTAEKTKKLNLEMRLKIRQK